MRIDAQTSPATLTSVGTDRLSVYNVRNYGARGDGRLVANGAMSTGTAILTSATMLFTPADVGKDIRVGGAGAAAGALVTTISAYTNATTVTLSVNASTTVSAASVYVATNDTAAFTAALAALPGGKALLVVPPGTYNANVPITNQDDVSLLGMGGGSVLRPVQGIGLAVTNCARCRVDNLTFFAGTIGLSINGSTDSYFTRLYFTQQTTNAILVNGDGSMEIHFTDVTMREVLGGVYFSYTRTTATDSGGMYMNHVRAVRNSVGSTGYSFVSTAGTPSNAYIFMHQCVADNMTADAMVVQNMNSVRMTQCFYSTNSATGAALNINGGFEHVLEDVYLYNGTVGGVDLRLQGSVHEVLLQNMMFDGNAANTAINAQSGIANVQLGLYHNYIGPLVDSIPNLFGNNTQTPTAPATQFYTVGSGGSAGCIAVIDTGNATAKYLRNSGGALQVLNSAFSAAIFTVSDTGDVNYTGNLTPPDGGVISAGTTNGLKIGGGTTQKLGFYGGAPAVQPTGGAKTAAATYSANEQTMLQTAYNALRTLGLIS